MPRRHLRRLDRQDLKWLRQDLKWLVVVLSLLIILAVLLAVGMPALGRLILLRLLPRQLAGRRLASVRRDGGCDPPSRLPAVHPSRSSRPAAREPSEVEHRPDDPLPVGPEREPLAFLEWAYEDAQVRVTDGATPT